MIPQALPSPDKASISQLHTICQCNQFVPPVPKHLQSVPNQLALLLDMYWQALCLQFQEAKVCAFTNDQE